MKIPVLNINQAGQCLVMGIIVRAFNNILGLAGKGNYRPCPTIFTRFTKDRYRNIYKALHKNNIRIFIPAGCR
jgi:hypothetical protein